MAHLAHPLVRRTGEILVLVYDEKPTTASRLVMEGGYNWVNLPSNIDDRFPIELRSAPVTQTIEFVEPCYHNLPTYSVLAGLKDLGLDPPTHDVAFYLGIQHPDAQRERNIVVPHKPVQGPHGPGVLVLSGNSSERCLYLGLYRSTWPASWTFAAVPKPVVTEALLFRPIFAAEAA